MLSISASTSNRLLKKAPNFVLGSSKSSTYPRGYASGFDSPAALLAAFLSSLPGTNYFKTSSHADVKPGRALVNPTF